MQVGEMAVEAVRILTHSMTSAASGAGEVAQGVATRLLADVVANRLRSRGNEREWESFTRDPRNSSLVEYLLRQAAEEDADFRLSLAEAVRGAKAERPAGVSVNSISVGRDGDAQIGDRRDTYGNHNRVVSGGGSLYEGEFTQYQDGDTYEGDVHHGSVGRYALIAVVVLALLLLVFKGIPAVIDDGGGDGLSASSTCKEFLNADQGTESQALVAIATSKGLGGFGSPLALPAIRYECSYHPAESLGTVIEQYKNQF